MISELLQKDNLTEGALRISGVLKRAKDLLQSKDFVCFLILDLPHNSVSLQGGSELNRKSPNVAYALAKLLDNLEAVENVLIDLFVVRHL